jgi:hypothetical protein
MRVDQDFLCFGTQPPQILSPVRRSQSLGGNDPGATFAPILGNPVVTGFAPAKERQKADTESEKKFH